MRAVFNMQNENDMVAAFEPVLMELDAKIDLTPVMTAPELEAGFRALMR